MGFFKVVVVGEYESGKTSLISQLCEARFTNDYIETMGVDFAIKVFQRGGGASSDDNSARVQLWDISGRERLGHMTNTYYKGAHGAVFVIDATKAKSDMRKQFDNWNENLKSNFDSYSGMPILIILNKMDLVHDDTDVRSLINDLKAGYPNSTVVAYSAKQNRAYLHDMNFNTSNSPQNIVEIMDIYVRKLESQAPQATVTSNAGGRNGTRVVCTGFGLPHNKVNSLSVEELRTNYIRNGGSRIRAALIFGLFRSNSKEKCLETLRTRAFDGNMLARSNDASYKTVFPAP